MTFHRPLSSRIARIACALALLGAAPGTTGCSSHGLASTGGDGGSRGQGDSGSDRDLRGDAGPRSCPGTPCDLVCQSCPSPQKCSLDERNASACMASGVRGPGQSCGASGSDDCAAGSICLAVTLDGQGSACFRYCRSDGDCPGAACDIAIEGTGESVCGESMSACSLLPQGGCGAGAACFVVDAHGGTGCHVAGTGGLAGACGSDYDCLPGFSCFQAPAGCQRLCRLGGGGDCDKGRTCTAVMGWTGAFGICL